LADRGDDKATLAQPDSFLAQCEAQQAHAALVHSDEHAA
jgi:hypothetical protein